MCCDDDVIFGVATWQGRGYALPADLAVYDRRREVAVVSPLRDCAGKELAMHCHLAR